MRGCRSATPMRAQFARENRERLAMFHECARTTEKCGIIGSAEPFGPWRRPMSTSMYWTETTIELPGVREGGMSGRNVQRKPGTTRGSPRRSRTAKASRISRHAVKSRCAHEWGGWGRLSDHGPRQHNSNPSEDPWGGGVITLQGGAQSSARPDTVRDNRCRYEVHEGRMQMEHRKRMPGAGLSC